MARVNVFLTDELLQAIDAEAAGASVKRSTLIQEALTRHLDSLRREREEAEARRDMAEAGRGMDALAEKLGSWDANKVIREFRDTRSMTVHERPKGYRTTKRKGRA